MDPTPGPDTMLRNARKRSRRSSNLQGKLWVPGHERRMFSGPIGGITTRDAESQSPEVISMGEEQLPQSISRRHRPHLLVVRPPGRPLRSAALALLVGCRRCCFPTGDAPRIRITDAMMEIAHGRCELGLGDVDLSGMHPVPPLLQWQEWDGVVDVRDPSVCAVVAHFRPKLESVVKVLHQGLVADPWLSESRDLRPPSTGLEFQTRQCGNRSSERVSHERDLIVGILGHKSLQMRVDVRTRVLP